jgi:hypothetical protein
MTLELLAQVGAIFLVSMVVFMLTRPSNDKDAIMEWNPYATTELTGIQRYSHYHRKLHHQKSLSRSSSSSVDADRDGIGKKEPLVMGSSSSVSSRTSVETASSHDD